MNIQTITYDIDYAINVRYIRIMKKKGSNSLINYFNETKELAITSFLETEEVSLHNQHSKPNKTNTDTEIFILSEEKFINENEELVKVIKPYDVGYVYILKVKD